MVVYPDAVDVGTLGIHPTNPAKLNSQNAKGAQSRLLDEGGGPEAGQHWRFATGKYEFAEPLTIVRRIWLEGPSGSGRSSQAHLSFPAGSDGLVFDGQKPVVGAQGATASNLRIKSAKGGGVGHGVIITAPSVHLTGLYVTGFRGDGIHVFGDKTITNADNFYLERVDVYDCGESLDVERLEAKKSDPDNLNALRVEIATKTAHRLKAGDRFWLESPYWHHELPYDPDKLPHPKLFHCGNYFVFDSPSAKTLIAETTDEFLSPEAKSFYSSHPVAQDSYTLVTGHGLTTRGADSNTGNIVA